MPTPTEIELPTTPDSRVIATAHMLPTPRVWELHVDGRWHDTHGNHRSGHRLRDVTVDYVAPAVDGKDAAA